jgi:hypothetical protein
MNAPYGRCEECAAKYRPTGSWSRDRDMSSHHRFVRAVRARAKGRCEAIVDGARCTETERLQAHHLRPGDDDPALGRLLCPRHHRAVDPHAR